MPFNRSGDTGATYPLLMKLAGVRGVDDRTINEVAGFVWRLSMLSSAHLTDYVVDAGTVQMMANGDANTRRLLKLCTRVGLLTKTTVDGFTCFVIIDDPEFIHIRTKAEIEWERQQKADARNVHLTRQVRHRDGDQCRYCGVAVTWQGRGNARKGTYDHLEPGDAATVDTLVVACWSCNSGQRDLNGEDRTDLRPPPEKPFYRVGTAKWLTENGYPVEPSEQRPGDQPDNAQPTGTTKRAPRQRPGRQPDTASPTATGDSDPAEAGPRAPVDDHHGAHAPPTRAAPANADVRRVTQAIETTSVGSGRDRSGSALDSPTDPLSTARRRKRSPRGRTQP